MQKIERNALQHADIAGGCNKGSSAQSQTVINIYITG